MNVDELEGAVLEFHDRFGMPWRELDDPKALDEEEGRLHYKLLVEEVTEFWRGTVSGDLAEQADALADIIYLAVGGLVRMGVALGPLMDEVHDSNMSKLGADGKPVVREDGKIEKGPYYRPPDIAGVIEHQKKMQDANLSPDYFKDCPF